MTNDDRSALAPQALGLAAAIALAAQLGLAPKAQAAPLAGKAHACAKGFHASRAPGREHSCSMDSKESHASPAGAGPARTVAFDRTAPCKDARSPACGPKSPTNGVSPPPR